VTSILHTLKALFWALTLLGLIVPGLVDLRNSAVDGRNPAPVDRRFIPLLLGFQPSKVVQDFFHPQYVSDMCAAGTHAHNVVSKKYK